MLHYKPHTWLVYTPVKTRSIDGVVEGLTYSAAVQDYGQITPKQDTVVYSETGIQMTNPYQVFADIASAAYYKLGAIIEWNGRWFRVAGLPRFWEAENTTNYIGIEVLQLQAEPDMEIV